MAAEAKGPAFTTYLIFVWLGMCGLLPYQASIGAVDFYVATFGNDFMYYLTPCLVVPNLLTLIARLFLQHLFLNDQLNLYLGYLGMTVCMLAMPVVMSRNVVLLLATAIGMFNAIAQASCQGLAAEHGGGYGSAVQTGQGVAGVAAVAVRICSKLVAARLTTSVLLYFGFASVVTGSAALLVWSGDLGKKKAEITEHLLNRNTAGSEANAISILCQIRSLLLCCFLNLFVTLVLFPGVISELRANDGFGFDHEYISLVLIWTFNITDLVGKYLPSFRSCRCPSSTMLCAAVLARFALIPLFLQLRRSPQATSLLGGATIVMGLTNGMFGSMAFELLPSMCPHNAGGAAPTMVLFIVLGVSSGSVAAAVVKAS